jgi:branched-chain amino acid transport system substrate-binding protein
VVVASVGTLSGPIGATVGPVLLGAQVWAKHINESGGLSGHTVRLIAYDDGGDPARHRAQVKEAVERHRVVAFVANPEVVTGRSSVEYITANRVPVIGGDSAGNWFYESPMYFPQSTTGFAMLFAVLASAAQQSVPAGKTKLWTVACVEAEECDNADRIWSESAKPLGFEVVLRSRVSVAQPDFTAECLAARRASAQVVILGTDSNSVRRVAASCARQGYHPRYATPSTNTVHTFKDDPNLDGMVGSSMVFPWFQSDTPASNEYQLAVKSYGRVDPGVGPAMGWVAAKLLEKAGANMPEPPTREAILQGLWSIKHDDLGGLTHPLTFIEGQASTPQACWFNIAVQAQSWMSPDGFKVNCQGMGRR